jgi:hypothetical protein
MTRRMGSWTATALSVVLMATACMSSDDEQTDAPNAVDWGSFKAGATHVVDGRELYIVEWDIPLTLEELRAYYERHVALPADGSPAGLGSAQSPLLVHLVNGVDDVHL